MAARIPGSSPRTRKTDGATRAATTRAKAAPAAPKIVVHDKPYTKSQMILALSEHMDCSKSDIRTLLEYQEQIIAAHLKKLGTFLWSGFFKISVVKKAATRARKGTNPFTGEPMTIKAKAAHRKVRIRPLSKLKALV